MTKEKAKRATASWIKRIKECLSIDTLSRDIAVGLIDRVDVSETYRIGGETNLDISINISSGIYRKRKKPAESHPTKDNLLAGPILNCHQHQKRY
jgi:hypothetical protein